MAVIDQAKRGARAKYRVFRWEVASGATGAWATTHVHTPTGPVEGRLLSAPRRRHALSGAAGGAPERTSLQIEVDNADGSLGDLLIGTTSGNANNEYNGDSVLNLRGRLYAGYIADDGTIEEVVLTPWMRCVTEPSWGELVVSLALTADDEEILGEAALQVSVDSLRFASHHTNGERIAAGGTAVTEFGGVFDSSAWGSFRDRITENLPTYLPLAFGPTPIPLTITTNPDGSLLEGILYISRHQPTVDDFEVNRAADASWSITTGSEGQRVEGIQLSGEDTEGHFAGTEMWSVKVSVRNDYDESSVDVWLVGMTIRLQPEYSWVVGIGEREAVPVAGTTYAGSDVVLFPPLGNKLSSSARPDSPSELLRSVLTECSAAGSAGLDTASWDRAKAFRRSDAYLVGGLVRGGPRLSSVVEAVARPFAWNLWIGLDGLLHILAPNAWNDADRAAAAGSSLDELRQGVDVFKFREAVPRTPEARGAAVSKIWIDWSAEQERYYASTPLVRKKLAEQVLELGPIVEVRLSGAWLNPKRATEILSSAAERRSFVARRWEVEAQDYLALRELGTLVRYTNPLAVGTGASGTRGYSRRLGRLEGFEDDEREHVMAIIEDLGPIENIKSCVWDDINNWVKYDPAGANRKLEVASGAADQMRVTDSVGTPVAMFDATFVGCHIAVPGAASAATRAVVYRIAALVGAAPTATVQVDVAPAGGAETIGVVPIATEPEDAAWIVLESEETNPDSGKLTDCNEGTGVYRDGVTAGCQLMGG